MRFTVVLALAAMFSSTTAFAKDLGRKACVTLEESAHNYAWCLATYLNDDNCNYQHPRADDATEKKFRAYCHARAKNTSPCGRLPDKEKALCMKFDDISRSACDVKGAPEDDVLLCEALAADKFTMCSGLKDRTLKNICTQVIAVHMDQAIIADVNAKAAADRENQRLAQQALMDIDAMSDASEDVGDDQLFAMRSDSQDLDAVDNSDDVDINDLFARRKSQDLDAAMPSKDEIAQQMAEDAKLATLLSMRPEPKKPWADYPMAEAFPPHFAVNGSPVFVSRDRTANASLWVQHQADGSLKPYYFIGLEEPPAVGGSPEFIQAFGLCSVLATHWLNRPTGSLSVPQLGRYLPRYAEVLLSFNGLSDQVKFATAELGGAQVMKYDIFMKSLELAQAGAKVWLGSRDHVVAAVILKQGGGNDVRYYDPNQGSALVISYAAFRKELGRYNMDTVVVKGVEAAL